MATFTFTNGYVLINSVDLSDHVESVTLNYQAETVDDTAMGDTSRSYKGALKNWTATINFQQDFAAGKVDATVFSQVGSKIPVEFRPVNAARSATNPGYTGNGMIDTYPIIGGKVGELMMSQVQIKPCKGSTPGDQNLSRQTS